ncbi:MAG: D-glycero-alpha-D-manno-heptose-1,7-bisphosphate 7-phosphatase [Bacteroidia bacterium]
MSQAFPLSLKDIDRSWTLFIDRDGVINQKRDNDYVKRWEEFIFIAGSLAALNHFRQLFGRMLIVTNQRGIDRGLMTEEDLSIIHQKMLAEIANQGAQIDQVYYCPHHPENDHRAWRKPQIGMALQAKKDFPEIDFQRSIMIGDAWSDMEFGRNAGMHTIWISSQEMPVANAPLVDLQLPSLHALSQLLP